MASYFVRRPFAHIDVLETEDESLRKGFAEDAPTIGRLETDTHSSSAHILFTRPLVVGTALSNLRGATTAVFRPLSPACTDFTHCTLAAKNEEIDYALLRCQEIAGAALHLKAAYPKITRKSTTHFLAYNAEKGEKVVGTGMPGNADCGGYCTDAVGSNHITEVITGAGRISVGDPRIVKLYDESIWPLSELYFRTIKQHYFTYFRQFEVDRGLSPAGNENRVEFRFYHDYWEMKIRSFIRTCYRNLRDFIKQTVAKE